MTDTRYLQANGVRIAYSVTGAGEPLVLVHGFTGNSDDWELVVDELARDRTVVTFDHRGHGASTNTGDPSTYTLGQLADDLDALVEHLGFWCFDLVGHSMGGVVAQRYVLEHPEKVASLVLMDTFGAVPDGGLGLFEAGIAMVRNGGFAQLLDTIAPFLRQGANPGDIERSVRASYARMDPVAFEALGSEMARMPSLLAELGTVRAPTTIMVGELDGPFRGAAEQLAAAIPGAELVVIPGAGHSPPREATDAWLRAVADHLTRSGRPVPPAG
ncbi:MAG TPA: alpha/beta fold hydrolase [Acidimicrobiales bacterium]|nr:alpha/beta fold hydrolase [Acidimicrobiales bacterium]